MSSGCMGSRKTSSTHKRQQEFPQGWGRPIFCTGTNDDAENENKTMAIAKSFNVLIYFQCFNIF